MVTGIACHKSAGVRSGVRCAAATALLLTLPVAAQQQENPAPDVDQLQQRLTEEWDRLNSLQKQLEEREKQLSEDRRAMQEQRQRLEALQNQLGGKPSSGAPQASQQPAPQQPAPQQPAPQQPQVRQQPAQPAPPAQPPAGTQPQPVGQAPQRQDTRPPEIAPISQQPGVLTPKGKWVLEPSLQYAHSTTNRLFVAGFTIIPAINIGLFDIRTVKQDTWTGALTVRRGLTNRWEVEAKLPYIYRRDSTIARPIGVPTATDDLFAATGNGLGDIELATRYQFNDGGIDRPYYVGTLRLKTRTGKDQFEVETFQPFTGSSETLTKELPTGSGFYGIQPGLIVIYPSDPAVFFGGVNYLWNIERSNVRADDGTAIGDVDPGDIVGLSFGMGFALNERASLSLGYTHEVVEKPTVNGQVVRLSTTSHVGTLSIGYSYRLSPKRNLNVSLGVGVTRDAPDVQLTVRVPTTF